MLEGQRAAPPRRRPRGAALRGVRSAQLLVRPASAAVRRGRPRRMAGAPALRRTRTSVAVHLGGRAGGHAGTRSAGACRRVPLPIVERVRPTLGAVDEAGPARGSSRSLACTTRACTRTALSRVRVGPGQRRAGVDIAIGMSRTATPCNETLTLTLTAAELAANAVRHGHVSGRDFHLRPVQCAVEATTVLRIEVADTPTERCPSLDAPTASAFDEEAGRGLLLVSRLANR